MTADVSERAFLAGIIADPALYDTFAADLCRNRFFEEPARAAIAGALILHMEDGGEPDGAWLSTLSSPAVAGEVQRILATPPPNRDVMQVHRRRLHHAWLDKHPTVRAAGPLDL